VLFSTDESRPKCVETNLVLPHCIDDFEGQDMHEMNCLEHTHLKLTAAKMSGKECKALLMELVLACNGAQLSDDFLIKLARSMKHHGIGIIVDEVLTCGRCGTFLLTTKKN